MKDLNRYIKESLLDDEDDLVDDNTSIVMGWLAQNVGFGFSHSPIKDRVNEYFSNNDGHVDMNKKMYGLIFTFINTPSTGFIKKINTENNHINIDYPIKSQTDIDVFTGITYISNQKLLKKLTIPLAKNRSQYNTLEFVNISKIQDIAIDCNGNSASIHVVFTGRCPIKSFDDLAEISCINIDKSFRSVFELCGSFAKKIKEELQNLDMNGKAIDSYINKKYGDILNKIHEKSGCNCIVLGRNVNAPLIDYDKGKGKWSYNNK